MAAAGLTQQRVADDLGIQQSQLSRRLSGLITFDVVEIEKVANLCGVSAASFFKDEVAA
jgi:transcriptional regulator with XRE-family HTH domain